MPQPRRRHRRCESHGGVACLLVASQKARDWDVGPLWRIKGSRRPWCYKAKTDLRGYCARCYSSCLVCLALLSNYAGKKLGEPLLALMTLLFVSPFSAGKEMLPRAISLWPMRVLVLSTNMRRLFSMTPLHVTSDIIKLHSIWISPA